MLPNPSSPPYDLVTITPLLQHLHWLTTTYPIMFRILCLAKPPLWPYLNPVLLRVAYTSGWVTCSAFAEKGQPFPASVPLLRLLSPRIVPISIFLSLTYTPSSSHLASFPPLNLSGLYLNLFSDTRFCLNCFGTLTSYLLSLDRVSYKTIPGLVRDQTLLLEQGTLPEGRWKLRTLGAGTQAEPGVLTASKGQN